VLLLGLGRGGGVAVREQLGLPGEFEIPPIETPAVRVPELADRLAVQEVLERRSIIHGASPLGFAGVDRRRSRHRTLRMRLPEGVE
jgi:hypothetical protein